MANDGWFKCEDCGYAVKAKVPDYVQQLSSPCPHCGGKMKEGVSMGKCKDCSFFVQDSDKGYCQLKDERVSMNQSCPDHEEA